MVFVPDSYTITIVSTGLLQDEACVDCYDGLVEAYVLFESEEYSWHT